MRCEIRWPWPGAFGLLGVLAALWLTAWPAHAVPPSIDISALEHMELRAPAEFAGADLATGFTSISNARFAPLTTREINRGISDRAWWLRVRLDNPSAADKAWVLHHEAPYLDHLTAWVADDDGPFREIALTDRAPFPTRVLDFRKLGIEHTTPAGSHTDVYLRLALDKPDTMTLNFDLWDAAHFRSAAAAQNLVHGIYFGVMLSLLFLALLMATMLRHRLYLYYAAFLAASTMMWAMLGGYTFQYLWPYWVYFQNEGFHIVFLLVAITALQFSRGFLRTAELQPRVDRLLMAVQIVLGMGIALRLAGVWLPVLWLAFGGLSLLLLLPALGLWAWRRGLRYARWYALAWTVYSLGIFISVLSAGSSIFGSGMKSLAFAQIGSLIEALLLLVALGERLTAWEDDRRQALAQAQTDPLTGLGNRRRLLHALEEFRERFARNQEPVFALMLDLDHFKRINDRFGHDAGDAVLREVGALLQKHSRPDDVCIRYGGEEFAVLVQAPDSHTATEIAERIRREFAAHPTRYRNETIEHTLSAGVAEVQSSRADLDLGQMLREADQALLYAKATGRNQTMTPESILSGNGLVTADQSASRP